VKLYIPNTFDFLPSDNSEIMNNMADFINSFEGNSAAVSVAEGISGVLVKIPDPEDIEEISFTYNSPNESMNVGAPFLFYLHVLQFLLLKNFRKNVGHVSG